MTSVASIRTHFPSPSSGEPNGSKDGNIDFFYVEQECNQESLTTCNTEKDCNDLHSIHIDYKQLNNSETSDQQPQELLTQIFLTHLCHL